MLLPCTYVWQLMYLLLCYWVGVCYDSCHCTTRPRGTQHRTRIDRVLDLYLRQYRRWCALSLEVSVIIPYLASLTNLLDTPELRTPELRDRQPAPTPAHCSTLGALPLLVACARPTATTAPPPAGSIHSSPSLPGPLCCSGRRLVSLWKIRYGRGSPAVALSLVHFLLIHFLFLFTPEPEGATI